MKTRLLASFIHLLASVAVISVLLLFIYLIWYPGPLAEQHGVMEALRVLIGVDVVLGPLMTMIIFNTKKPRTELVRDLSIIVLVQLSALAWGTHITLKVRPVFEVFYDGTIYSVAANDIDLSAETSSSEVSMPHFWQRPKHYFVPALKEQEATQQVMDMITKGLPDIQLQTVRYLPVAENREAILEKAKDMDVYLEQEKNKEQLETFLQCYGGTRDDYIFYPLEYGPYSSIIGIRRDDLSFTGLLTPVSGI